MHHAFKREKNGLVAVMIALASYTSDLWLTIWIRTRSTCYDNVAKSRNLISAYLTSMRVRAIF